jgi:hypothetical protein
MTKLKYFDKRENTNPTFGDLNIGDWFTSVDSEVPFIKTAEMYDEHKDPYNSVALDGEFYWSDDDEEVEPIQKVEITIKK